MSGENKQRIFFVNAPPGQTVQLNGLTLTNGLAQGGNGNIGGGAGGGGAGLGGAVFVNSGNVAFSSVAFQNNSVKGGNGGFGVQGGGGGGGGLGFGGGAGGSNANILGTFYTLGGGGGGGARTSAGSRTLGCRLARVAASMAESVEPTEERWWMAVMLRAPMAAEAEVAWMKPPRPASATPAVTEETEATSAEEEVEAVATWIIPEWGAPVVSEEEGAEVVMSLTRLLAEEATVALAAEEEAEADRPTSPCMALL